MDSMVWHIRPCLELSEAVMGDDDKLVWDIVDAARTFIPDSPSVWEEPPFL